MKKSFKLFMAHKGVIKLSTFWQWWWHFQFHSCNCIWKNEFSLSHTCSFVIVSENHKLSSSYHIFIQSSVDSISYFNQWNGFFCSHPVNIDIWCGRVVSLSSK
jgi:hypothetical protein